MTSLIMTNVVAPPSLYRITQKMKHFRQWQFHFAISFFVISSISKEIIKRQFERRLKCFFRFEGQKDQSWKFCSFQIELLSTTTLPRLDSLRCLNRYTFEGQTTGRHLA